VNEICEICKRNKASLSAIIQGVYYKFLCEDCKPAPNVSSGHARWARDIDLQDHEADIQQPYGKDGKPNPHFIRLYPKQAKAVFSEKQMRDASR
jgi:hypothetical protein